MVRLAADESIMAIELSALSEPELPSLLAWLDERPALPFQWVAAHGPSKQRRMPEQELVALLESLTRYVEVVVLHPDKIDDGALYRELGSKLAIENMTLASPSVRRPASWRSLSTSFRRRDCVSTSLTHPRWMRRWTKVGSSLIALDRENAKLRTSRTMLFAGGLLPVLFCRLREKDEIPGFLAQQFAAVPVDRVAWRSSRWGSSMNEGLRCLGAYDEWISMLQDDETRKAIGALRESTRDDSPVFERVRSVRSRLQLGLLALLFESDLAPQSRRFLVFDAGPRRPRVSRRSGDRGVGWRTRNRPHTSSRRAVRQKDARALPPWPDLGPMSARVAAWMWPRVAAGPARELLQNV